MDKNKVRIHKLLSEYGFCSRRKAEDLIKQGRVSVNGRVVGVGDKACEHQKLLVNGRPIRKVQKKYLMLNKPLGCVTALEDNKFKTVMDYINVGIRIFPIGRLDYNTSGLLLFTNDGDFANKIMHPRYEIEKTYRVRIDGELKDSDVKEIENGIIVDGKKTWPGKINKIKPGIFDITIHEGRNRIVRKMMSALGHSVLSLKRIAIGGVKINGLQTGRYRNLTSDEINKLLKK